MQTSVITKTSGIFEFHGEIRAPNSPDSLPSNITNIYVPKEAHDENQPERISEPNGIFGFPKEAVSPIGRFSKSGSRMRRSAFFEQSPILETSNTSFNNFLKKVNSSQVEVIPSSVIDKSVNGSSRDESYDNCQATPEKRGNCAKKSAFFSTKVHGDKSHKHLSLALDEDIIRYISSDALNEEEDTKREKDGSEEVGNYLSSDINELLEPKKMVSHNTNVIDDENDSDLDAYFNDNHEGNSEGFVDSSRKLNLIFEPENKKGSSLSINILNCHSNEDINMQSIPFHARKQSDAGKQQMQQILNSLEKPTSPVAVSNVLEGSDSDLKASDNSDFLKLNRFPKIKLRLKMNNNLKLNMESQKSVDLSPQSSKKRFSIMRSNTLKRSLFDNVNSRQELSRKDSCEPLNSHNLSKDFEDVYYGDNKFVNSKNTITNRLRKTSAGGFAGSISNENQLFLNLPDLKNLNVSSSKKDLFANSQLFDISSLNQLKKSDEQSLLSSNNQDTLIKNNNHVSSRYINMPSRNLFSDVFNQNNEYASNPENDFSKDGLLPQEESNDKMRPKNFSSKDSFFGNGTKTLAINRQKRFKTGSQAFINFNSGLNNIDIDEENHDEMSRKSSPVKLQTKNHNKRRDRFDFTAKSTKRCLLDDVQSSMTRSDKKSLFNDNYEIIENLGSGHFGTVFKCKNKFDGLIYAIKVLNTATKTAINEAQALASLNVMYESTHIVRYFSSWKEDQTVYIVMEMCSKNLEQWSHQTPKIDEKMIRKIIKHLCKALSKLHKDKMVHLDIKPENILISNSGKYKLSDLGLVKVLENKEDVRTLTEGDARYMAKELLNDFSFEDVSSNKADLTKADIFSLGITMYELMTRNVINLPKNGQLWHQLRDNNIPMLEKLGSYSNSLKRLISSMMDSDPAKRPSAKDIINNYLLYSKHNKVRLLKEQIKLLKDEVKKSSLAIENNKAEIDRS